MPPFGRADHRILLPIERHSVGVQRGCATISRMSGPHDRSIRPFALEDAATILARTPATLCALLRDLPESWINAHEGGDTWSPFDVIGHLIHADRTNWIPRAITILEHGDAKPFVEFDRFAHFEDSKGRTLSSLLDEFAAVRQASVAALRRTVTAADLGRVGQHPALGVVTLQQLLAAWVVHDLDHLMQISRVLARQYTDAVGPWRQYLRIVREP
jgi:hypothetical protein